LSRFIKPIKKIKMKKLFVFGIIASGLALASCKKDHTCTCDADVLGFTVSYDTVLTDMSKSDAKAACEGMSFDFGTLGSQTCGL
jgi:hypothetical protein